VPNCACQCMAMVGQCVYGRYAVGGRRLSREELEGDRSTSEGPSDCLRVLASAAENNCRAE
jgi:hypothetical protein